MKKIHIISFITTGLLAYIMIYLLNLTGFLNRMSPMNPLTSTYGNVYETIPKHLHGLWKFYEVLEPHMPLILIVSMILTVLSLLIFLASFDPKQTLFIRTPVEVVLAIFTAALYLAFMAFVTAANFIPDPWGLLVNARAVVMALGILLLIKHLYAKIRLGIFRRSTLIGMLKKPAKATPSSDDVKDLKDSLGINGLDAPWIHPTRLG